MAYVNLRDKLRGAMRILGMSLMVAPAICVAQSLQPAQVLGPSGQEAPDGPPLRLGFGTSIAPGHRVLMIGMPQYQNNTGRVVFFTRDPSGAWRRTGSLDAPAHAPGDLFFGQSIALNDDVVLVSTGIGTPDLYLYRQVKGQWKLAR